MNEKINSQNSLNKKSSSLVKKCIFYSSLFLLLILSLREFHDGFLSRYVFQEWLINYSQGFVRRGLLGTFFLFLRKNYDLNLWVVISYFSGFVLLLFSGIYLLKVRHTLKILNWETLLVVLFLPTLILFPINDNGVGRKEYFFFFGLLINLFFIEKTLKVLDADRNPKNLLAIQSLKEPINNYCFSLFIWYNLLSVPAALSHESIFLLGIPINLIVTSNFLGLAFKNKVVFWRTFIIYFPTILISLLCFLFKGNSQLVSGICQSWSEFSDVYDVVSINCNNHEILNNPITYLAVPPTYFIKEASRQLKDLPIWILSFSLVTAILMRASSRIMTSFLENLKHEFTLRDDSDSFSLIQSVNIVDIITIFSFKYAFLPFLASGILYATISDWGRWFYMINMTYAFCFLSPSLMIVEIAKFHTPNQVGSKGILSIFYPVYQNYAKVEKFLYNQNLLKRFSIIYFPFLIYTLFALRVPILSNDIGNLYGSALFKWISSMR